MAKKKQETEVREKQHSTADAEAEAALAAGNSTEPEAASTYDPPSLQEAAASVLAAIDAKGLRAQVGSRETRELRQALDLT